MHTNENQQTNTRDVLYNASVRMLFLVRATSTGPAADKVEVFIDDKPVYVDPGSTVLQVGHWRLGSTILQVDSTIFQVDSIKIERFCL